MKKPSRLSPTRPKGAAASAFRRKERRATSSALRPRRARAAELDAIEIDVNRTLLNRYRFISHETLICLAGWLPATATFELKCELGRTIWENAQHVQALFLRLREIQSPAFQRPADPALVALMSEMPHAPDEFALALSWYHVIAPGLIQALEAHETATFPNSDQPSIHAIKHILFDLRSQAERGASLLDQAERTQQITAAARDWARYVSRLLSAAGGASGLGERPASPSAPPSARKPFTPPREAQRDARFSHRGATSATAITEEDYENHTVQEFERYSTEMLAAETVGLVMYSLKEMPWEFHHDSARHLYDEVRHALMGYEWMRRHGRDPFRAPQYLHIFKWRSQFPPLMQYCLLTMGNEVHAFPYRHRRLAAHQKSGDRLSEQFVRYDIADETQHVRFGKRWLPELLKRTGEKRPLARYTADVLDIWKNQYLTGKLPITVE